MSAPKQPRLSRVREDVGEGITDIWRLLVWLSRDPLRPRIWKTLLIAFGLIVSQYLQVAGVLTLTYAFLYFGSEIGGGTSWFSLPVVKLDAGTLWVLSSIAVMFFVAQIVVTYYCRIALLRLAMGYYHASIHRAIDRFTDGLTPRGATEPLLGSNLVASFALRESRYIGTGFLSLANLGTSAVTLTVTFILLSIHDWQVTLLLAGLVLLLLPLQLPILRRSTSASHDILIGSGLFATDLRGSLGRVSRVPLLDPLPVADPAGTIVETGNGWLESRGARRFLDGFERRIQLGYVSQLLGQATYALLLSVILIVFLLKMEAGSTAASEIVRYVVLLGPALTSLNAIVTSTISITASKPYFQSYLDAFPEPQTTQRPTIGTAEAIARGASPQHGVVSADRHETGRRVVSCTVPSPETLAARPPRPFALAIFPADVVEWPEFLRLQEDLVTTGLVPHGWPAADMMLITASWPDEPFDIDDWFAAPVRAALDALKSSNRAFVNIIDELLARLADARSTDDGRTEPALLTPRDRILIGIFVGSAVGRALFIPLTEFLRVPERERMFVANMCNRVPIVVASARLPSVQYAPEPDKAVVFFGDGTSADVDPKSVTKLDEATEHRLNAASIHVRGTATDPNEFD